MDVRATDTSILAAKRIEFEKVAPVTQKPKRLGEDHIAAAAAENDDEKRKPDDDSDNDTEQVGDADEHYPQDGNESEAPPPDAADGEHHILDVRV